MESESLLVVAALLIAYAAVSRRLAGTIVTPAIAFVVVGLILGNAGLDVFGSEASPGGIRLLAEATLALVLFSDASGIDTQALRREEGTPVRLLTVGLPLTIALGSILAIWTFSDLAAWEAVVLAVLLAPTDAALGQSVVTDERLPSPLRQGLNTESGLNDGVCVPLLVSAVTFAVLEQAPSFDGSVVRDLVEELLVAVATGVVVAVVVSIVWRQADRRGSISGQWAQVVPLAAAAIAYVATDELGGSGFIACFVAGLVFGRLLGPARNAVIDLTEEVGGVLSAVTFFMFAAVLAGPAIDRLDVSTVVYAVLSLTVIRMVPVAIAFLGTARQTVAFAGWFGPRGLASIVFALTIVEESDLNGVTRVVDVATITVLLSVFAHGVSAPGLTDRYVRWFDAHRTSLELERAEAETSPRRRGGLWSHRGD